MRAARVIAAPLAAAMALTGCTTALVKHSGPPTQATFDALKPSNVFSIAATLRDGSTLYGVQRDFGDAMCGSYGCVAKADIVSIDWETNEEQFSPAMVVLSPLLAATAPVMAPYALALWSHQNSAGRREPVGEADAATLKRIWLDNLTIKDGKAYLSYPNPCLSSGFLPADFATDVEALNWLWDRRNDAPHECLTFAAQGYALIGGELGHERAMRTWSLGAVRGRWMGARCLVNYAEVWPITPDLFLDPEPGRGDPDALTHIEAALRDPESYRDVEDLKAHCRQNPVAPETYWPEIRAQLETAGPFSRRGPQTVTALSVAADQATRGETN